MKAATVIKHPSSQQRAKEVSDRFFRLRKEHEAAVNRLWAGTLAMNFTDEELSLVPYLLCPNDLALMERVRKPIHARKQS